MKKIFLMVMMLGTLGLVFSWDEERDISNEIYIPGISKNIFNFQVRDPLHLVKEFYLGLGLILDENWKLGIVGQFQNEVLSTVNDLSRSYHQNPDGTLGGIQSETKENSFIGGPIRNLLYSYVGIKLAEKINIGFSLGGGLDYSKWESTDVKYQNNFTTSGLLNILNPGIDDNRIRSYRYQGSSPIQIGFGMSLLERPFVNSQDNQIDEKEFFYSLWRLNTQHRLRFGILGAGSAPATLPVLNSSGISLSPFNGAGDQYFLEQIVYRNNTNLEKSYSTVHNENFTWFTVRYDGMVETEINMHDWELFSFQGWDRLRFIPELDAWFEWKFYGNTIDEESTYYYEAIFGHINGDYNIRKTVYTIFPHLNFGTQLPFELDFRPTKEVQIRFLYTPLLGFEILNYDAQYQEDHIQNGVNVSYKDPKLTGSYFRLDHRHSVGVRFRFEPASVFRIALGGTWTWSSYAETSTLKSNDNVRRFFNGTTGPGPYTQIPANNKTLGSWTQSVASQLEINYQLVPNLATFNFRWEPSLTIVTPQDSNILNLSNWNIQVIITYESKQAPKPVAAESEQNFNQSIPNQ